MPFFDAPATVDALTANGGTDGYVTVTSNAQYYPGAYVCVRGDTVAGQRYRITNLSGSTKIGLQKVPSFGDPQNQGPRYTRSDLSAYTTADNAKVFQEPSVVRVELSNIQKTPLI
jgi:hypothetical protein